MTRNMRRGPIKPRIASFFTPNEGRHWYNCRNCGSITRTVGGLCGTCSGYLRERGALPPAEHRCRFCGVNISYSDEGYFGYFHLLCAPFKLDTPDEDYTEAYSRAPVEFGLVEFMAQLPKNGITARRYLRNVRES